jgi:hypothetical protein
MENYKYSYTTNQFPNNKYSLSKIDREIRASSIVTALDYLNGNNIGVDVFFKAELGSNDITILNGLVSVHDGEDDYVDHVDVKIVDSSIQQAVRIESEWRDRSGKLRVHQTSRKLGLRTGWTGRGDDTTDVTKVGGGETLMFHHSIGDAEPLIKYIDFNIIMNETWAHEGYFTWKDCNMNTLSLQMVPRTVTVSGVTGGNKAVYGGYLVVPTAPGQGNIEVVNDLTKPDGGLVYIPNSDLDVPSTAYWDADFNTSTKKFENIRPNYSGTGRFNIFSYEVIFAQFVRQIPLLGSGFIALDSSDTDQLGHGMRFKMIAETNGSVDDHEWSVACILCMHRQRSV